MTRTTLALLSVFSVFGGGCAISDEAVISTGDDPAVAGSAGGGTARQRLGALARLEAAADSPPLPPVSLLPATK